MLKNTIKTLSAFVLSFSVLFSNVNVMAQIKQDGDTNSNETTTENQKNEQGILEVETVTTVEDSKGDSYSAYLTGVSYSLVDENYNVVSEWVSDTKKYQVSIDTGTYTLIENSVPNGYLLNGNEKITITANSVLNVTRRYSIDTEFISKYGDVIDISQNTSKGDNLNSDKTDNYDQYYGMQEGLLPSDSSTDYSNDYSGDSKGISGAKGAKGGSNLRGAGPDIASGTEGTCAWVIDSDGKLTIGDGTSCTLASVTDPSSWGWYNYRNQITSVAIDGTVATGAAAEGMFFWQPNITSIDLTGLDTSNTTSFSGIFGNCSSLTSVILPASFGVAATDMTYLFYGCSSLEYLVLSNYMGGASGTLVSTLNLPSSIDFRHTKYIDGTITGDTSKYSGTAMMTMTPAQLAGTWEAANYYITYDKNNASATGSMKRQAIAEGNSAYIRSNAYSDPTGVQSFTEWNTAPDGTGTSYSAGVSITPVSDITLYAQWAYNNQSIDFYSGSDGLFEGGTNYNTATYSFAEVNSVIVPTLYSGTYKEPIANAERMRFAEWNTASDGTGVSVADESEIQPTTTTLYAQYEEDVIALGTTGTCAWKIWGDGALEIGTEGQSCSLGNVYGATSWPWYSYRTQITSAEIKGFVATNNYASGMFTGQNNNTSIDLTGLDTSNTTRGMDSMFADCTSLTSLELPTGFGQSATNMSYMFSDCTHLESLELPANFGASATDMTQMFLRNSALTSLEFPTGFGVSATSMSSMFAQCSSLEELTLPAGFGQNTTNMYQMFESCQSLTTLNLPAGFGSSANNVYSMFYYCSSLETLNLPANFGQSVTNMSQMFQNCTSLETLALPANFGTSVTDMSGMFAYCSHMPSLTLPTGFGASATNISGMFNGCTSLEEIELPASFGASATNISGMFNGCTSLEEIELPASFGASATTMYQMFQRCTSLETLVLPASFGSSATDMSFMFKGCTSLTSLELPAGFGQSATNMTWMFSSCTSLEHLVLSEYMGGANGNLVSTLNIPSSIELRHTKNIDGTDTGDSAKYNGTAMMTMTPAQLAGTWEVPPLHTMTISNVVDGNAGDKSKVFTFTVTIAGVSQTVNIGHNESITIQDIDDGVAYAIVPAPVDDYSFTYLQGLPSGLVDDDLVIDIKATQTMVVPTAVSVDEPLGYLMLIIIAALALACINKIRSLRTSE